MKYVFLFLLSLSSCGHPYIIEQTFIPEYNKFLNFAVDRNIALQQDRIQHLSITAKSLPYLVLGQCEEYGGDYTVRIDRTYWSNATWVGQEAVLFHELGHCLLGRKHLNDVDTTTGTYVSIMNEYQLDNRSLSQRYDYYINELFTHLYNNSEEQ